MEDQDAATNAKVYYYKVYAANACGTETPLAPRVRRPRKASL